MYFDLLVAVIVLVGAFWGFRRGFVSAVISILFLIIGIVLGFMFANPLGTRILAIWDVTFPTLAYVVGFFVVFSASVVIGGLIAKMLSDLASEVGLKAPGRVIGFVFGVILGSFIVLTVFIVGRVPMTEWGMLQDSITVPYIKHIADEYDQYINELYEIF